MKPFHNNSKSQLMQAIYQEQTYVLITPDQPIKVLISGKIKSMEEALREAIESNNQFRNMVIRALQPNEEKNTPVVLFNVLTSESVES